MGALGRYIDRLPEAARDRVIQAQSWCIAEVVGPAEARCLIGHAEDWRPLAVARAWWRRWMDGEVGAVGVPCEELPPEGELEALCRPEFFAFRRARPADMAVYRDRLERLGLASERAIGSRFDRLCIRRGTAAAVRLIKARAAGAAPDLGPRPATSRPGPERPAGAGTR